MKQYKPEWKLYIWKKILIDPIDSEKLSQPSDFVYFTSADMRAGMVAEIDKMAQEARPAILARLGGTQTSTSQNTEYLFNNSYWMADWVKSIGAIIELASQEFETLQITEIRLQKQFIEEYREKRRAFLKSLRRKNAILITGESKYYRHSAQEKIKNDPYFANRQCELPSHIYKKVDKEEELSISELAELTKITFEHPFEENLQSNIRFKVKINHEKLKNVLDGYVHEFETEQLIGPIGLQYFGPDIQRNNILHAIKAISSKFGSKNLQITSELIAEYCGWDIGVEKRYRFFETLFSLEKSFDLRINDLRKSEVIVSLIEAKPLEIKPVAEIKVFDPRENYKLEYNQFGVKRDVADRISFSDKLALNQKPEPFPAKIRRIQTIKPVKMAAEILPEKVDFRTAIETGIGYAVIQGEKIRIGKITSGKFRLAEMIWHTFGIAQTIDTIFNATQPKNSSGGNISDPYTGPSRKLALLENQTKEINRSISSYAKRKKLKNLTFRINLNTDSRKHPKMAWFTKRVG